MNNDKRFFGNKTAAERDLAKRRASRLNGTFDSSNVEDMVDSAINVAYAVSDVVDSGSPWSDNSSSYDSCSSSYDSGSSSWNAPKIKILDVTVILMTVLSLYALFVMQERLNYQSEQVIHDMTHTNFKR